MLKSKMMLLFLNIGKPKRLCMCIPKWRVV